MKNATPIGHASLITSKIFNMILEPLIVPAYPNEILDELEAAIAGEHCYLPVPPNDQLLRRTLKAGQSIDDDIALVVATSGSTGTPKGALLTAANLVSSADATHQYLGGEAQWLLAMPGYHIAGIQVLIRSLIAGYNPLILDVTHGFNISEFARIANTLDDTTYTSLTPMQLLKAMDTLEGIEALRRFAAILVGGAPLRADDLRAAKELGINVVTTYGSSETSGGCVYNGRPIPGAKVRVVGERIHLGGPMVARGYRNGEEFGDWFTTSDTGTITDGVLTVTGRVDTIIDSGGLKIHPEILEQQILSVRGVSGVCVVGVPDRRLGQAIVAAYEGSAHPTEIITALDDLPRWQLPKDIRRVDQLPLIGPGKVNRQAVLKMLDTSISHRGA
ncbi:2-succinylbenzoate--CoA ligase [Corynebacterium diphtheriae subsp. lausannense]|nr:2-succinylbenzoate--CoA ligase [Corynebacterium diphtheriae subsp. lausannense]